jgi:hypothetical protein
VDVGPCQSCALAYAENQRALEKQSESVSSTLAHRVERRDQLRISNADRRCGVIPSHRPRNLELFSND